MVLSRRTFGDAGLNALKAQLPAFDAPVSDQGGWSYYAVTPKQQASVHYHLAHLGQLDWLYKTTHDCVFLYYLQRWTKGYLMRYPTGLSFYADTSHHVLKINLRARPVWFLIQDFRPIITVAPPEKFWSEFNITLGNVNIVSEKSYGTSHTVVLPMQADSAPPYLMRVWVYASSPFPGTSNYTVLCSEETYLWAQSEEFTTRTMTLPNQDLHYDHCTASSSSIGRDTLLLPIAAIVVILFGIVGLFSMKSANWRPTSNTEDHRRKKTKKNPMLQNLVSNAERYTSGVTQTSSDRIRTT